MPDKKIGWIGVGLLGTPIVERFLGAGYDVVLHSRRRQSLEAFEGKALLVNSPAEVAAEADIIFSALPGDKAFESVATEVLKALKPGQIYCDISTVSPEISIKVSEECGEFVRAPVSGSVTHAKAGNLVVLGSGIKSTFDELAPVFSVFSNTQLYVGPGDQARYLKLLINNLVGATAGLMAESLIVGEKAGLNRDLVLDALAQSAVGSPLVKYKAETLKAENYAPAFPTTAMVKDITLFAEAAGKLNCASPYADLTVGLLKENAARESRGEEDFSALTKLFSERASFSNVAAE
ncbi:MAG: NAD(P)-dependent oxidoreductase [Pseudomonadota bacterium]